MTGQELFSLARIGYELWKAHLIGTSALSHQRRMARMEALIPGDIVIELSTAGWWARGERIPGGFDISVCIGIFVEEKQEPWPDQGEEEWIPSTERVYYIRSLDDSQHTHRWTNARMVTILPVEGWPVGQ